MHEIKIYGDISSQRGEGLYTLLDLQEALALNYDKKDVLIRIKTDGGSVNEGLAIYTELRRYAKENNVKITTRPDGLVASIGTIIYLAGDLRISNHYMQPFMHEAWGGDSEEIEEVNKMLADFYGEHTLLTSEEARELMRLETYLPEDMALNIKFSTQKEEIKIPEFMNKFTGKKSDKEANNLNSKDKMSVEKENKNVLKELVNMISSALGGKDNVKNKVVFDAVQNEINFFELAENEPVIEGVKATYKGVPASGEITTSEGQILVFENGILNKIKKTEDLIKQENEALKLEVAELQNSLNQKELVLKTLKVELENKIKVVEEIEGLKSKIDVQDKKEAPGKEDVNVSRFKDVKLL